MRLRSFWPSALGLMIVVLLSACSQEQGQQMASSLKQVEEAGTRALNQRAIEMSYPSVASFKFGRLSADMAKGLDFADKRLSLVVLVETGTPWLAPLRQNLARTADDKFNGHLEAYQLKIAKYFSVEGKMEALVLEAQEALEPKMALDAARDLSMIEGVEMVEVKEAPAADQPSPSETAKN